MTEGVGRVFLGLSALAVLWIIVYWWWEPPNRVSFDPGGGAALKSASGMNPVAPPADPPREVREPAKPATPTQPAKMAVIPPRFRDYTVKQGETIEGIATKELGSAKYASAILSANALMSPEHLKAGRVIRIPLDPTNIQGKAVPPETKAAATPKPETTAPAPKTEPATTQASAPADKVTEYLVKSGDSLSAISKKFYGTTTLTDLIFQANRGPARQ
jgi:nucleoid-associated protein YgaU